MQPVTDLRDKAAQLVFVRIGSNMQPPRTVEEDAAAVEALLERHAIGGLCLFRGQWPETRETLARLQRKSRFPLLVGTDMERGIGQQVRGLTLFPHALAFSRLGDGAEAAVEAFARAAAREALACGIHIAFMPVADVSRNPRNPIIATRAFGTDPGTAARLAAAYVRGSRAEGLLSTAKHFPGHGNTSEDSHAVLPTVDASREELDAMDLVPFRAALEAGVELVMTAHVAYPALDPTGRPATASHPILVELLRGELGFRGAVVSDSLLMGGIRQEGADPADQAVELVAAGVDILLDVPDPEGWILALVRAVEEGRLPEARLDEAVGRIQALRRQLTERFGSGVFLDPPQGGLPAGAPPAEHRALAGRTAAAALTRFGAVSGAFPFSTEKPVHAVLIKPSASHLDPPEQPLAAALRARFPEVRYVEVGPATGEAELERLLEALEGAEQLVVAPIVKPSAWTNFGLLPAQHRFVERLAARQPVVLASLGVPTLLEQFPGAAVRLCTYSDVPASQDALAAATAGETGV